METMRDVVAQEANELRYSRKHIDTKIEREILDNPDMIDKIIHGLELIEEYRNKTYYESKNTRIAQLSNLDMHALILNIFVGIAYCQVEELFTSVTSKLAGRLKFSDKTEAITTVAELIAVLCQTDAFDIAKSNKMSSLMVISCIPLSKELIEFIINSQYLPPMVCVPRTLTNNFTSGYLTHNDSVILGNGNQHDGDLCLDVLNTMNSVALKLNTAFLCSLEETPTFAIDTAEKAHQWAAFKRQSYTFYSLIAQAGNRFFLTHKVDKRGRIYASGYHISTQGTSFKKAMIELHHEEHLEGMP